VPPSNPREYQQKCIYQCQVCAIEHEMFDKDAYFVAYRGGSQLFEGRRKGKFVDEIAGPELAIEETFRIYIH
jgi:hypothetical protein